MKDIAVITKWGRRPTSAAPLHTRQSNDHAQKF